MSRSLSQHVYHYSQPMHDEVLHAFVEKINKQYQDSVVGIVFYGSCMRTREYNDAILDFYVIIDKYSLAYDSYWLRFANSALPPNVFYLQICVDEKIYRAKYAVMSKKSLFANVNKAFHSYFWARFTQPMTCIYMHNEEFKQWFVGIQCAASKSFFYNVLSSVSKNSTSSEFWIKGFQLTYAAELRAESKSRAVTIYENNREYYDGVFSGLVAEYNFSPQNKFINNIKWKVRILYGKFLSVLRLMKATTTFVGGVDYIAWKIERHTGEPVSVSDKARKYPWIYIWPIVFNLFI